jgi:hypothetical protein
VLNRTCRTAHNPDPPPGGLLLAVLFLWVFLFAFLWQAVSFGFVGFIAVFVFYNSLSVEMEIEDRPWVTWVSGPGSRSPRSGAPSVALSGPVACSCWMLGVGCWLLAASLPHCRCRARPRALAAMRDAPRASSWSCRPRRGWERRAASSQKRHGPYAPPRRRVFPIPQSQKARALFPEKGGEWYKIYDKKDLATRVSVT